MIAQIRSLLWLDFPMYALTDLKKLGMLFEKSKFIPATLILPFFAALTDILALYLVFGSAQTFFQAITSGLMAISLLYLVFSWISASLVAGGADFSADTSVLRVFSIINTTYLYKLFVLPLVAAFSALSFAAPLIFITGQLAASVAGIVCTAYCLATVCSLSVSRSLMSVIVPHIIYSFMHLFCFISLIFFAFSATS